VMRCDTPCIVTSPCHSALIMYNLSTPGGTASSDAIELNEAIRSLFLLDFSPRNYSKMARKALSSTKKKQNVQKDAEFAPEPAIPRPKLRKVTEVIATDDEGEDFDTEEWTDEEE
jgi:hypothetical protein